MPALAPFTVDDRKATPVAHTFNPNGEQTPGVFEYVERTGVPIGEVKFTISTRASGNTHKVKLKLVSPKIVNETINGVVVPKALNAAFADLQFTFPDTWTEAERNDLVGIFTNAMAATQPQIHNVVVKAERTY